MPLIELNNNMNIRHRYLLEPGSKKHPCPNCKKKRLVRYVDACTNNYLREKYGRCDREINCGYHLNPYLYGYGKHNIWQIQSRHERKTKPAFIPVEILKLTLQGYENNVFLQNLLVSVPFPFETKDIENVISLYFLGTICKGYRIGAITFPFIDTNGRIRAIQVKQFNGSNNSISTDFLHSIIEKFHNEKNEQLPDWLKAYIQTERKVSCLFGEHLIQRYPLNPIALVEAPKTAIYGTLYFGFPDNPNNLLWMAVYNLSSLNYDKVKALRDRNIILFPDLSADGSAFTSWKEKANSLKSIMKGTNFEVSDLLEKWANIEQKKMGLDLADFLADMDWRDFRNAYQPNRSKPTVEEREITEDINSIFPANDLDLFSPDNEFDPIIKVDEEVKEIWPIEELQRVFGIEGYFDGKKLPDEPIDTPRGKIFNLQKFISSNLNTIISHNGKKTYRPYIERLMGLKQYLESTMIKNKACNKKNQ
jgi:hypothetical protein